MGKMITLYLSGIFASKSIKIIPSAEFFPEGTRYLNFFFKDEFFHGALSFIYSKQTVSKTAVHIHMCIAECSV